jgi:hypothetical protein
MVLRDRDHQLVFGRPSTYHAWKPNNFLQAEKRVLELTENKKKSKKTKRNKNQKNQKQKKIKKEIKIKSNCTYFLIDLQNKHFFQN